MAATKKATGAKGAKSPGKKTPDRRNADKRVRDLANLLAETGLCEIEIEEGGTRIRVASGSRVAAPVAAPLAAAPAPVADAAAAPETPVGEHPGAVNSPMVGTVYVATEPGADPFVRAGDRVEVGQTLLIVEAMKVMNPIQAPKSGRVIEILVSDAEPVEYGQPLLIIE